MLEDKWLLWKLRHGNKDALRLLYEKYKDNLRTIAASMLHDSHTAEDVLHDVFVTFAENARQLRIRTSLKSYLATCVANRTRDEFRRKSPQTIDFDNAEPISSNSNSPAGRIIADEKSKLIADALATIPFDQRQVILLHLKGDCKFREIAKLQQTSISTVHGRYKYGLKKLRTILDEELVK